MSDIKKEFAGYALLNYIELAGMLLSIIWRLKMINPEVLSLKELCTSLNISRSMAYLKFTRGSKHCDKEFPRPIKLGARKIGFLKTHKDDWLAGLSKVA